MVTVFDLKRMNDYGCVHPRTPHGFYYTYTGFLFKQTKMSRSSR